MANTKLSPVQVKSWQLTFPAHDKAPRLFLEWLRDRQENVRITFSVSTKPSADDVLNDEFVITFDNITKQDATDCEQYIMINT
jgi:hypothetical protein